MSTTKSVSLPDLELGHLIRHFELALLDSYSAGELAGTTHTCLGQEYIPIAVTRLLEPRDWILSNHRCHGHFLARYPDPLPLLAEIMGRAGALNGGHGGSQHLKTDRFMSTGIQAEGLGIAAGVALRLRDTEPGMVAIAYVGDGTFGQGLLYETLNLAALWHLPLLVVVENNQIAQSTPVHLQMAGTISSRAAAFEIPHLRLTQRGPEELRHRIDPVLQRVRSGAGPAIVEIATFRLGPHSKGDDTRSSAELERLMSQDWLAEHEREFSKESKAASQRAKALIANAMADVLKRPLAR
jgi:pyruvate dehydrogenase E1 component alpha subunit